MRLGQLLNILKYNKMEVTKMNHQALRPFAMIIALLCLTVVGGCGDITSDIGNAATATVPAATRIVPSPSPTQSSKLILPDLTAAGLKEIVLSEEEAKTGVGGNPLAVKYYAAATDVTTTAKIVQTALQKAGYVKFRYSINNSYFFYSCIQKGDSPVLEYLILDYKGLYPYSNLSPSHTPITTPINTPQISDKIEMQMRGYKTEIALNFRSTNNCYTDEVPPYGTPVSVPITIPITVITATPERVPATAHP